MSGLQRRSGSPLTGGRARYLSEHTIAGHLYAINDEYPGLTLSTDGHSITGQLWKVYDPRLHNELDCWEEYDSTNLQQSLYNKQSIDIGGICVWVYLWNHDVYGLEQLPHSSWQQYLNETI